jgi:hypothetical protein
VGLVLMEDAKHRVRRRLHRLALARGLSLDDLDGLVQWFRPPLLLASREGMADMEHYVSEYDLDYLHIDNWSYVASGKSDNADDVAPQLAALSRIRYVRARLLTGITQHARKPPRERGAERLAEMIRNSSHFGAWYDVGWVLSRADEQAPVTFRAEMRDLPAPDPFVFTVRDQFPGDPANSMPPSGWMRLRVSDQRPAIMEREAVAERFVPDVLTFLAKHPGCSKEQLKRGITGDNSLILAAFDLLCDRGEARYVEPEKRGTAGRCEATPAVPRCNPAGSGVGLPPLAPPTTPLKGVGGSSGVAPSTAAAATRHSGVPGTPAELFEDEVDQ